ncbi:MULTISPECIES: hypothetical protein [unclassified Flagellimonas]|uniref:VOC domain-containing protein n=1 Tax=Flagellimonas sp. MMG031 TaxID=3158549 RepID=A0AAU7N1D7_9FLAO
MEKILKFYRDLLGIDLNDSAHPIVQKINSIPSSSKRDREIKEHHLRILGLSLMDIKDYDKSIYEYYTKRIVNNTDLSIHGHIFEINQCAHFIRVSTDNNMKFEFGDPNKNQPDFIVESNGFEITSSRFTEFTEDSNPGIKLVRKFREKNKKNYADMDCVLLIDINQMSYHTMKNGKPVSPTFEEIRETIRNESKFGLVMYFVEWIENNNGNLNFRGTVYTDYNTKCKPELKKLMESYFIKGNHNFGDEVIMSAN